MKPSEISAMWPEKRSPKTGRRRPKSLLNGDMDARRKELFLILQILVAELLIRADSKQQSAQNAAMANPGADRGGSVPGTNPKCPHCEEIELRRNGRSGFLQREVLSRLGYFPWECGQCREIYMLKLRSTGYRTVVEPPLPATLLHRLLLKDRS